MERALLRGRPEGGLSLCDSRLTGGRGLARAQGLGQLAHGVQAQDALTQSAAERGFQPAQQLDPLQAAQTDLTFEGCGPRDRPEGALTTDLSGQLADDGQDALFHGRGG